MMNTSDLRGHLYSLDHLSQFHPLHLKVEKEKSKLSSKPVLCSEQRIVDLQLNRMGQTNNLQMF